MNSEWRTKLNTIVLACSLLFVGGAIYKASTSDAMEECFNLLDDDGTPLRNVPILATSVIGWKPGRDFGTDIKEETTVTTDSNGNACIKIARGNGQIQFLIRGSDSIYEQRWNRHADQLSAQPKPIFAKSRKTPTTMFIRDVGPVYPYWTLSLPSRDYPCSFDLLIGDWLPPHGKGIIADMTFSLEASAPYISPSEAFDVTLKVIFPGSGNGICPANSREPGTSSMPLPREAPADGYADKVILRMWREAGRAIQSDIGDVTDYSKGYFFRIRTVVGDDGRIQSSRYGKILGPLGFRILDGDKTPLQFRYFVNGEENSRNMEHRFDKNLFGDSDPAGRQRRN